MSVSGRQTISVSLKDGTNVDYIMRGLTADEIPFWAQFCASIFSYKTNPPPPSYFERHFFNDPDRDASLVRVLIFEDEIVSSCRIFQRRVSLGGEKSAHAGGIGEVCTSPDHRKRGLSKILLQDCIRIMTQQGMQLSFLHAAPEFFSVYEKNGGYASITSAWSVISINHADFPKDESYTARLAQFPRDTRQLQALHQEYSERRFVGCINRSEAYWNEYISKELDGTLLTLVNDQDDIVAWLSIRPRGDLFQLREFGCDREAVNVYKAMFLLLTKALQDNDQVVRLHLPTAVVEELRESAGTATVDWTTMVSQDDHGWMYKSLDDDEAIMSDIAKDNNHLIWPADGF